MEISGSGYGIAMKKSLLRFYRHYFLKLVTLLYARLGERNFFVLTGLLVGIISALAAVLLKMLVHHLQDIHLFLTKHNLTGIVALLPLAGIVIAFLIQKLFWGIKNYDKSLSNLIHLLGLNRSDMPFRKTFSHLLTSGFTVGLGGSAGLEAPIVLTGAAIGANTGSLFRIDKKKKMLLLGCGSAAGIAAIFDSPVAGVLFAAEVLLPEFSVSALIPVLLASATSAVISKMLYGRQLFLLVSTSWDIKALPFFLILGIICALIGVYMIRTAYGLGGWMKRRIPNQWVLLFVGGLVLSAILYLCPVLLGDGYEMVTLLFSGNIAEIVRHSPLAGWFGNHIWVPVFFCLTVIMLKVVVTILTVESGGDGGIFAPSMFTGAFTGFTFAHFINLTGIFKLNEPNFIAAGMCGVFTAVMRAPMTGIFLIAEVTGGYMMLIPLMLVSAIAFFTARIFEPYSVYTKVLAERNMLFHEDKDNAILNRIAVGTIVEHDFVPVRRNDTFRRLVELITVSNQNLFPVIDDDDRLVGTVNLDTVRTMLLNQEVYDMILVYDIMDEPLGVLRPENNLSQAMIHFEVYHLPQIPVVDASGKYMGFVSKTGIFAQYRNLVKQAATSF